MKKLLSVMLVAFVLMGCNQTAANALSLEEAQTIALKEVDGKVLKAKEDKDDGVSYYDFTIVTESEKYEIEVDANTGSIIKKEKDDDYVGANNSQQNTTEQNNTGTTNNGTQTTISAEEAQQIALNRVGGGYLVKWELDDQDDSQGYLKYEIEIKNGNKEYEIHINATTGEIVKFEEDYDD